MVRVKKKRRDFMAFTFPTFSSLTQPVTHASAGPFAAAYESINAPTLTRQQRQIIAIVAGIGLAANSVYGDSKNYASDHKTLVSDARALTGGISRFDLHEALPILLYMGSVVAGGAPSSNIATLLDQGKDFQGYNEDDLDKMIALLFMRSL